jgi:prepilin-type N-terminal cleavage/methylation domain-containing protein
MISKQKGHRRRRGLTLAELMTSIVIVSVLSVGATNLVIAALRTDRVLLDSNRQVSEMELAIRRMTHDIRTGSNLSIASSSSFSLTTQADPGNNGQSYTVTYTYDSAGKTLSETNSKYGSTANIIAYNVSAFSVTLAKSSPIVLSISITISGTNITTRTQRSFQVMNRNS